MVKLPLTGLVYCKFQAFQLCEWQILLKILNYHGLWENKKLSEEIDRNYIG